MALLSSRSDGRDSAKGALEPNVAGDQWSEKQNTGGGGGLGGLGVGLGGLGVGLGGLGVGLGVGGLGGLGALNHFSEMVSVNFDLG